MDTTQAVIRQVSNCINTLQLQPRLLHKLAGSQQPSHEALLRICMRQETRHVAWRVLCTTLAQKRLPSLLRHITRFELHTSAESGDLHAGCLWWAPSLT